MILRTEDRYNFNPEDADIATGIEDSENGKFERTGLAHQYTSYATIFLGPALVRDQLKGWAAELTPAAAGVLLYWLSRPVITDLLGHRRSSSSR